MNTAIRATILFCLLIASASHSVLAGGRAKAPRPKLTPVMKNAHTAVMRKSSPYTMWRVANIHPKSANVLIHQADVLNLSFGRSSLLGDGLVLKLANMRQRLFVPNTAEVWQRDPLNGFEIRDFTHGTLQINPYTNFKKLVLPKRSDRRSIGSFNLMGFGNAIVDKNGQVLLQTASSTLVQIGVGNLQDKLLIENPSGEQITIEARDLVDPSFQEPHHPKI